MSSTALHAVHEAYLGHLDAVLVGPRRARRSLVAEAGDHLEDATDALVDAGLDPDTAAVRALSDFGAVAEVAPAYQETMAVASSRRTAYLLLLVMTVQPFLWDSGLNLGTKVHGNPPDGWLYPLLDRAIEVGGAVSIVGALLVVALTGVGRRWVPVTAPRVARMTGAFAIGCAVVLSLIALSMASMTTPPLTFWLLGVALMAAPLAAVARSGRRTLAAA